MAVVSLCGSSSICCPYSSRHTRGNNSLLIPTTALPQTLSSNLSLSLVICTVTRNIEQHCSVRWPFLISNFVSLRPQFCCQIHWDYSLLKFEDSEKSWFLDKLLDVKVGIFKPSLLGEGYKQYNRWELFNFTACHRPRSSLNACFNFAVSGYLMISRKVLGEVKFILFSYEAANTWSYWWNAIGRHKITN